MRYCSHYYFYYWFRDIFENRSLRWDRIHCSFLICVPFIYLSGKIAINNNDLGLHESKYVRKEHIAITRTIWALCLKATPTNTFLTPDLNNRETSNAKWIDIRIPSWMLYGNYWGPSNIDSLWVDISTLHSVPYSSKFCENVGSFSPNAGSTIKQQLISFRLTLC